LLVESNSVQPRFKVLLYPFQDGEELPITHWNASRDSLQIQFSDETHFVRFYPDANDNTQFELYEPQPNSTRDWSEKTLSVFPNPAQKEFSIHSNEAIQEIELYHFTGQLVLKQELANSRKDYRMRLPDLPTGAYLLKVSGLDYQIQTTALMIE